MSSLLQACISWSSSLYSLSSWVHTSTILGTWVYRVQSSYFNRSILRHYFCIHRSDHLFSIFSKSLYPLKFRSLTLLKIKLEVYIVIYWLTICNYSFRLRFLFLFKNPIMDIAFIIFIRYGTCICDLEPTQYYTV